MLYNITGGWPPPPTCDDRRLGLGRGMVLVEPLRKRAQQEQQKENQVELAWRCSLLLFASEFEAQSSAPGRNYKR